ncbi:MAG: DUF1289 domain-containing protein [Gemmatimonadetes bacterium]|nr:DUF1289 domain-containing protein [Gemmatimonadota bacterium]
MNSAIPSPCRRICRLRPDLICDGCGRTVAEIGAWLSLSAADRATVMERTADWTVRGDDRERI